MAQSNPPQPQSGPGRSRISSNLVNAATAVPAFAAARAGGAGVIGSVAGGISAALTQTVLGPAAALAAILAGVLRTSIAIVRQTELYGRGIEKAASIERIESAFTTLLKSASRARQEVKSLLDFANRTPFRYGSVLEAGRTLLVLTKGAFAGAAALKQIGDVSAATNTQIEETAFWIGKLFNFLQQGRSVGALLFRLQDMGIISGELANRLETLEATGGTFAQKWAAVEQELRRADGAMKEESRSLDGLRQRLDRTIETMERGFGQPFLDQEKNSVYATIRALELFQPLVAQIGTEAAAVTGIWRGFTAELRGSLLQTLGVDKAAKALYETLTLLGGGAALAVLTRTFGAVTGSLARVGSGPFLGSRRATQAFRRDEITGAGATAAAGARADLSSARQNLSQALSQALSFAVADALVSLGRGTGQALRGYSRSVQARALEIAERSRERAASSGRIPRILGRTAQIGVGTATGAILLRDAWSGVLAVVRRLASLIGRGIFAIGPIGAFAAVVGGLVVHFKRLQGQISRAVEANNQLARSINDTSRAAREQTSNVRTLADHYADMASKIDNLVDAQKALAEFRRGDDEPRAQAQDRRSQLVFQVRQREAELENARKRGRGPLLRTAEEERERAVNRRELQDTEFQVAFDRADEAGRARLLAERAAKLQAEASQGNFLRESERLDPAAGRVREIEQRRQQLADEIANIVEPFEQLDRENPAAARAQVRDQLQFGGLSDAEKEEFFRLQALRPEIERSRSEVTSRRITAGGPEGEVTLTARERELEAAGQRLTDLARKAQAQTAPTDAEVTAELERRRGRRGVIEQERSALNEQRAQAERESESPLTRINREILDLQKQAQEAPAGSQQQNELLKRIEDLQAQAASQQIVKEQAPAIQQEATRVRAEAAAARFQADLTQEALQSERRILELRGEGLDYEIKAHALRLESLRAAAARTEAEFGAGDERTIAARNAVAEGERRGEALQRQRAQTAADLVTNRNIARAEVRRDRRGAQALRDQAEIRERARSLVETFGVSPEDAEAQARRDFFTEQAAEAVAAGPRITADSLQAIGGGGGVYGSDPIRQVMERATKANESSAVTLAQILALMQGQAPGPLDKPQS